MTYAPAGPAPILDKPPPRTQRAAAGWRVTEQGWDAEAVAAKMRVSWPEVTAAHVLAWTRDVNAGTTEPPLSPKSDASPRRDDNGEAAPPRRNRRWPARVRTEALRRVAAGETTYRVAKDMGLYPSLVNQWRTRANAKVPPPANTPRERFDAAIATARRENGLPPLPAEEAAVLWRAAVEP